MRVGAQVTRDLNQAVGIGAVIRTNHQNQVCFRGHLFDRDLSILGGIADVLRRRTLDIGKALLQSRDNVGSFIETEGRLSQIRDSIGIGYG